MFHHSLPRILLLKHLDSARFVWPIIVVGLRIVRLARVRLRRCHTILLIQLDLSVDESAREFTAYDACSRSLLARDALHLTDLILGVYTSLHGSAGSLIASHELRAERRLLRLYGQGGIHRRLGCRCAFVGPALRCLHPHLPLLISLDRDWRLTVTSRLFSSLYLTSHSESLHAVASLRKIVRVASNRIHHDKLFKWRRALMSDQNVGSLQLDRVQGALVTSTRPHLDTLSKYLAHEVLLGRHLRHISRLVHVLARDCPRLLHLLHELFSLQIGNLLVNVA